MLSIPTSFADRSWRNTGQVIERSEGGTLVCQYGSGVTLPMTTGNSYGVIRAARGVYIVDGYIIES